jgi:hypothetical protein
MLCTSLEGDYMRRCAVNRGQAFLASGALAIACVACGSKPETSVDEAQQRGDRTITPDLKSTRETNSEAHQAVTLEGCLQRSAGPNGIYLLTGVNEPSVLGTAGRTTGPASTVERERARVAARTYRAEAAGDLKLNEMVGRRVRVSGTIAEEPSGAPRIGPDRATEAAPGSKTRRESTARVDLKNFARVAVANASVVGDKCD